jgi:hypothetical protein
MALPEVVSSAEWLRARRPRVYETGRQRQRVRMLLGDG